MSVVLFFFWLCREDPEYTTIMEKIQSKSYGELLEHDEVGPRL